MPKTRTLRRSLISSFAFVIVLLTAGLVALPLLGGSRRAEEQSKRLLLRSMGETETRFSAFFRPVHVLLSTGRGWGARAVDDGGEAFLAAIASAIDNIPQIADVRIEGLGSWTLADFERQAIRWSRPRQVSESGELAITAYTPVAASDGTARLIAADVHLEAISEFTRTYQVTENTLLVALVPLLPPSQQVEGEIPTAVLIGLPGDPRFEDPAARRRAYLRRGRDLEIPVWQDAIAPLFARGLRPHDEPLRFESRGDTWWGGFWRYPLDPDLPIHTAILIPEHDFVGDHATWRLYLVVGALLALALALGLATRLSRRAGRPIEALVKQTDRIGRGDFAPGTPIRSRVLEVQRLAEAVESMRLGLANLLRLEHDLRVAHDIQQGTFPTGMPRIEGYELFGSSVPAEDTGGDTYDLIEVSAAFEGSAVLMLADATGHGIGPALSVAHLHAMLRMAVRLGAGIAELVRHANAQLREDLPADRFITAWFGVLDATTHQLQTYSCGHGPVYHYRAAEDRFVEMDSQSPPLGLFEFDVELPPPTALARNDMVIVLSDGFHESLSPEKELFEEQRVQDVIRANRDLHPQAIVAALHEAVDAFTRGTPPDDDRSCVIVKRIR